MTYEELWQKCFDIVKDPKCRFSTDGVVHHVGRRYVEASGNFRTSNKLLENLGYAWMKLRPEGEYGCIGNGLTHEQIIQMWQIAKEMGP